MDIENQQVIITGMLPAFIAGCFSLKVDYGTESVVISNPSLAYTNKFDIVIPEDKLPSFSPFSVALALCSNGICGPFTSSSQPVSIGMYVLITVYA